MRLNLWFKLMGILAVIVFMGAIITIVIINQVMVKQFEQFTQFSDVVHAQNFAVLLADYYARQGSWEGVNELLSGSQSTDLMMAETATQRRGMGMMGRGMMGQGMMDSNQSSIGMMTRQGMGFERVVLLDSQGALIADSQNILPQQSYQINQWAESVPIVVNEQQVGAVLVDSMIESGFNTLDADFLGAVNQAVWLSALAVGGMALALGSFFFFHITAPVRALTQAAEAVAEGDLSQQVAIDTGDEIARLGTAFNSMTKAIEKNELLRQHMVADIAHELRTPLSLIQGSLEAILDGVYDLNLENVASIHEESLVLNRLVGDLRELAQAEAGQLFLEKAELDLNELCKQTVDWFTSRAATQKVNLITNLSPNLPPIYGDEQRLKQVLTNLISNALRYTPPDGKITIASYLVKEAKTKNGTLLDKVAVSVSDTGQGIPAEDLPHVFERFYRADKSRTRGSGGSGLGLAIAQKIIEAHGGSINVESTVGQGSCFTFVL